MKINTESLVSIREANQNFSKVARLVDEKDVAVIMKNNAPRYIIMEFSQVEREQIAVIEDVLDLSKRFIEKNRDSYLELTNKT